MPSEYGQWKKDEKRRVALLRAGRTCFSDNNCLLFTIYFTSFTAKAADFIENAWGLKLASNLTMKSGILQPYFDYLHLSKVACTNTTDTARHLDLMVDIWLENETFIKHVYLSISKRNLKYLNQWEKVIWIFLVFHRPNGYFWHYSLQSFW